MTSIDESGLYYDEEDCLGFDVFAAELELVVGSKRGKADEAQLLELLQKLLATVSRTDKAILKQYQKRCETVFSSLLLNGVNLAVRQLINACLVRCYTHGDFIAIYARVSWLHSLLSAKESKSNLSESVRIGLMDCLTTLSAHHGRSLASYAPDSMSIASRAALGRVTAAPTLRIAGLNLAAAVVGGLNHVDRNTPGIQTEAWKVAEKAAKEKVYEEVRAGAHSVTAAMARAGGGVWWRDGADLWEDALRVALAGLEDSSQAVREAAALALAELAASARHDAVKEALAAEKRPAKRAAADAIVADAVRAALIVPLMEAAAAGKREVCIALALGWVSYLSSLQSQHSASGADIVEVALSLLSATQQLNGLRAPPSGDSSEEGAELGLGAGLACGEAPAAEAAILYVLRTGVMERLGEPEQRSLLARTAQLLAEPKASVAQIVVCAETLAALMEVLGEVSSEEGEGADASSIERSITAALARAAVIGVKGLTGAPATPAISACCSALAALARASPSNAAAILERAIAQVGLSASRETGSRSSSLDSQAATGAAMITTAHAVSSLLVACCSLPLGIPSRLLHRVYLGARTMISGVDGPGSARESGIIRLGAIWACDAHDLVKPISQEMLDLVSLALSASAVEELMRCSKPGGGDLGTAAGCMTAALEALIAYVMFATNDATPPNGAESLVTQVSTILEPLTTALTSTPSLSDLVSAGANAGLLARLQLRLLELYRVLLSAAFPQDMHASGLQQRLLELCMLSLRGDLLTGSAIAGAMCRATLRPLLCAEDAVLGPWTAGRGAMEDELRTYAGAPGGPRSYPWETGLQLIAGTSSALRGNASIADTAASSRAAALHALRLRPFPGVVGPGTALLEAQVLLVGAIWSDSGPELQIQILENLSKSLSALSSSGMAGRREKEREAAYARHRALSGIVAAVALAGLANYQRRGKSGSAAPLEPSDQVSERVLMLAYSILEDQEGDAALGRAVAEIIAGAVCAGSEALTLRVVRALVTDLVAGINEARDPERRRVLALSIGCIFRAKGGLALAPALPSAMEALLAAAARPTGATHLWALHALWLVARAAGPAYTAYVRNSLTLAQELLVSPAGSPSLRAHVAKLANAVVEVLGPEFRLGSSAYQKVKSLVTCDTTAGDSSSDAAADVNSTVTSGHDGDMAQSLLEAVLFAQQLVLFAPSAFPPQKYVPMLQATLSARLPPLRACAAATLRHLAERDAGALLGCHVEACLFAALDRESDAQISSQLRATLDALLLAGAPSALPYWLTLLGDVVAAKSSGNKPATGAGDTWGDKDEEGGADPSTRSGTAAAGHNSSHKAPLTTPRLRTRLLASELLRRLLTVVPAEASAQGNGGGNSLADHTQVLVDLGFKMSNGITEALKVGGVELLAGLVRALGRTPDPAVPELKLLDQYQAQLVGAMRSALGGAGGPDLIAAGGALVTQFLECGLASGDTTTMRRLMALLTGPLTQWADLGYEGYAEWVGVRARLAVLSAHAQVAVVAASLGGACAEVVGRAQQPHRSMLGGCWCGMLVDGIQIMLNCSSRGPPFPGSLLTNGVLGRSADALRREYAAARLPALHALALTLPSMLEENGDSSSAGFTVPARVRVALMGEVALMLLTETTAELAEASQGNAATEAEPRPAGSQLAGTLTALAAMLTPQLLAAGLLERLFVLDLLDSLSAAAVDGLQPLVSPSIPGDDSHIFRSLASTASIIGAITQYTCSSSSSSTANNSSVSTELPDLLASTIQIYLQVILKLMQSVSSSRSSTTNTTATLTTALSPILDALLSAATTLLRAYPHTALPTTSTPSNGSTPKVTDGMLEAGLQLLLNARNAAHLAAAQKFYRGATAAVAAQSVMSSQSSTLALDAVEQQIAHGVVMLADEYQRYAASCSTSGSSMETAEQRYLVLLSTAFTSASELSSMLHANSDRSSNHEASASSAGVAISHLLSVAAGALHSSSSSSSNSSSSAPAVQLCVVVALRSVLTEAMTESSAGAKVVWAIRCLTSLGPLAASIAHNILSTGPGGPPGTQQGRAELAAEVLKTLLLTVTLLAKHSDTGSITGSVPLTVDDVMNVLVQLLIEAIVPPPSGAVILTVRDLAVKLVTSLPSTAGPTGSAFRNTLAALPAAVKLRLQTALRAASTAEASASNSASGVKATAETQKPKIELKMTFGLAPQASS